ncbi:MAG: HAMP domain-containing sensor histidine kinase, partial [Actinomycetota bacterium]
AQAVVSFASERVGAFGPSEADYLESAGREAAAAFHILWCMGRDQHGARFVDATEQERQEWNRIIRHDLRSPLTVITGFADTMRAAWSDLPDDEKLDFVDAIARGAAAMTTLLADMEKVDKLESGDVSGQRRPMDLGELVEQTVKDLTAYNDRPVVMSVAEALPLAFADENDQRRVVTNLLENAFKFSEPDAVVEVRVLMSGGMIHTTVRDTGRGISCEDQKKLFQKFSRVGLGNGSRVPGTGLGLYICRSIVESHGGRIWVESEVGEGATFHFTTPAAALAALFAQVAGLSPLSGDNPNR